MKYLLWFFVLFLLPFQTLEAEEDLGPIDVPSSVFISNVRGGFVPQTIEVLEPGKMEFHTSVTHTNFWTVGRINFLDLESTQYHFGMRAGTSPRNELGIQFRLLWYGGGIFDKLIEKFHGWINAGSFSRYQWPRNTTAYQRKNINPYQPPTYAAEFPSGYFLNDIILTKKTSIIDGMLAWRSSIRLPVNTLVDGTGIINTLDYRYSFKWRYGHDLQVYGSISVAYYDKAEFFDMETIDWQLFLFGGIKAKWASRLYGVLQMHYETRSIHDKATAGIKMSDSFEWVLGIQWLATDRMLLQFAVIEDSTFSASEPDVSFHFSMRIRPN